LFGVVHVICTAAPILTVLCVIAGVDRVTRVTHVARQTDTGEGAGQVGTVASFVTWRIIALVYVNFTLATLVT